MKSLKDNGYYIGICKDLGNRIKTHNQGGTKSTKTRRPFVLLYKEEYADYGTAREREKLIKSWHGGNAFKKLVASAAGSSNGRIVDSESIHLGSNPSPATLPMNLASKSAEKQTNYTEIQSIFE